MGAQQKPTEHTWTSQDERKAWGRGYQEGKRDAQHAQRVRTADESEALLEQGQWEARRAHLARIAKFANRHGALRRPCRRCGVPILVMADVHGQHHAYDLDLRPHDETCDPENSVLAPSAEKTTPAAKKSADLCNSTRADSERSKGGRHGS